MSPRLNAALAVSAIALGAVWIGPDVANAASDFIYRHNIVTNGQLKAPPPDQQPDTFSFLHIIGAEPGTSRESDVVTPTGFDEPVTATVTGDGSPQISIDGGAWTTSGTLLPGQSIQVRLTSGAYGTTGTATVTVGGVSAEFSVTVRDQDTAPDAFAFEDIAGAEGNALVSSPAISPVGFADTASVSVSGDGSPKISINGGTWTDSGNMEPGDTLAVQLTSGPTDGSTRTAIVSVGGVSATWSVTTIDTVPNAFAFTNRTDANPDTVVTSIEVTPVGYDSPTQVSVTGTGTPQVSIAGGSWTTSGTATPGDTVAVRLTSGDYGSTRTASVTIGGVSANFSVTTRAQDTTPNAFAFTNQTGVNPNTAIQSNTVTLSGFDGPLTVSASNGATVSVNGGAYASSRSVNPGDTLRVRMTSAASGSTAKSTTVTVGGRSATWTVTTKAIPTGSWVMVGSNIGPMVDTCSAKPEACTIGDTCTRSISSMSVGLYECR